MENKTDGGGSGNFESAKKALLAAPQIAENLGLLGEIGVLPHLDALAGKVVKYESLLSQGLEIFSCDNIDSILEITVRQLSDIYLPSFMAFVWKPVQNRSDITLRAFRNYGPASIELKLDNVVAFESFFSKFPHPVYFAELEKKLKCDDTLASLKSVQTEIVVPITGPFDLYGIVLIGRKASGNGYSDDEMAFLQKYMFFVSQAIKSHLYYEHSLRDIKTGLYNHGFFMTRIKEEIAGTKRNFNSSSIIMIDVDRFKVFNDTYGHLAGDEVLEYLAQVIRQSVRTNDIPSRFGGEEFTVLLPNAEAATALLVAERLRENVSDMRVPWEVPLPTITISLGVCSFDQDTGLKTNDIIRRADEALYASKARGRNCTTIWTPNLANVIPGK